MQSSEAYSPYASPQIQYYLQSASTPGFNAGGSVHNGMASFYLPGTALPRTNFGTESQSQGAEDHPSTTTEGGSWKLDPGSGQWVYTRNSGEEIQAESILQ